MRSRNRGVALSYLNTVLNMGCGFFMSSFLVKMLGDTEYGLYQMVAAFVSYLVLLEFGTGTAMTRNICRCRAENMDMETIQRNISTIWSISVLLAFLITAAAVVFYSEIGNIYRNLSDSQVTYAQRIMAFQAVYLILSFLSSTLNGIVLGFEEYSIGSVISIVKLLSRTGLLICIISKYRYAIAIAIVDMVVSLAVGCYLTVFCMRNFQISFSMRMFDWKVFRETLPLCVAMFIQVLVNQANSSVDQFVIGIKLTPEAVAYYSIGLFFYSAFSSLTTVPITMYGPQIISDITRRVDEDVLMAHLITPSRLITLIGTTVLCGFVVAGRQFIALFYGNDYIVAWYVAIIIMVPMMINMSSGVLINVLDALNKRMVRSYVLLFTTVANILLTVVLIDIWGIIGACAATALCTFVGQVVIMSIYYAKKMKIRIMYLYYKAYDGILIPQLIATGIAFLIGARINSTLLSFAISCFCYLCIFCALYVLFGMQSQEKHICRSIIYKLRNTRR